MLKIFFRFVPFALLLTCAGAQAVKVGVSYDFGGTQDGGFNASANQGLKLAQKRLGIQTAEVNPDTATRQYNIATLAKNGADLIIGVGFLQQDVIQKVAAQYPKQQFAVIDGVVKGQNTTSVTFREEEGSFLVGYLAGMTTSTGVVGFLGGMDVPLIHKFQAGYAAGVKAANPKATIVAQYVGTTSDAWNNPGKAREIAASMTARGADIIFTAAGGSGMGVIDYIKQTQCLKASGLPRGVTFKSNAFADVKKSAAYTKACAGNTRPMFFIGVDSNQNHLGDFDKNPATMNHGLTSMLKRVDNAVYVMSMRASRKMSYPAELSLGLRESGVSYALDQYNGALVSPDSQARLENMKRLIVSGQVKVPNQ